MRQIYCPHLRSRLPYPLNHHPEKSALWYHSPPSLKMVDRENIWKCALDNGCNILSTDKVSRQPWAKVGNSPFVQKKTLENPDDTNLKRSKNLGLLSTLAKFASK